MARSYSPPIMRSNVQADQNNWLELLDGALMAINNAPIEALRKSPFEIENGYEMKTPYDVQSLSDQAWQNRGDASLESKSDGQVRIVLWYINQFFIQVLIFWAY
eukprot:COSAG02_NODE_161_length_32629_cov_10.363142_3_plen_104_part_00